MENRKIKSFAKSDFTPICLVPDTPTLFKPKKCTPLQAVSSLYHATREKGNFKKIRVPVELYEYAKYTYETNGDDIKKIKTDITLIPQEIPFDEELTVVLFSGGKESAALASRYKNVTKEVRLFHILGLNWAYPNEHYQCEKIAKKLGLENTYDEVKAYLPNNKGLPESPVKNLMTYVLMYEIYGAPKYTIFGDVQEGVQYNEDGTDYESVADGYEIEGENSNYGGFQTWAVSGDSREAGRYAQDFLSKSYSNQFEDNFVLESEVEAYEILIKQGLFDDISSCMTIEGIKQGQQKRLMKKAGTKLGDGSVFLNGTIPDGRNVYDVGVDLDSLTKADIKNGTELTDTYSCCACFKCAEKALIAYSYEMREYPDWYLEDCKRFIFNYLDSKTNLNKVNSRIYFEKSFGWTMEDIPLKYRNKVLGIESGEKKSK